MFNISTFFFYLICTVDIRVHLIHFQIWYMYVLNPPHEQDVTQGQFFNRFKFSFFDIPKLKSPLKVLLALCRQLHPGFALWSLCPFPRMDYIEAEIA